MFRTKFVLPNMIVFTSDNGGLSTLYSKNAPTSVEPLRGGKGWCYEGGIKVPLIIKIPDNTLGKKIETPVISMDFFPTLLELAKIEYKPKTRLEGKTIVPLLKGENKIKRDTLFWYYPHYHGSGWTPGAAIRVGNWKLIEFYDKEKSELYNLTEDFKEEYNLVLKNPIKVKELQKAMDVMMKKTNSKLPKNNNLKN